MKLKTFLLLLPLVFLSSCFEFIEEITYTDSEKGQCLLTLNCSQSKIKIKNLMKLDTFMGLNIPSIGQLQNDIIKAKKLIGEIEGINTVITSSDFDNFIFTVKFNFDSTASLNKALNAIAKVESTRHPIPYYTIYEKNNTQFIRNKVPDDSTSAKAVKQGNLSLIAGATATSIYRFAQPVKSISNAKALISKNKQAVMLKQPVADIIKKPSLFSNTILFK